MPVTQQPGVRYRFTHLAPLAPRCEPSCEHACFTPLAITPPCRMSLSCPWALHCRRCPWQHLWPAWRGLLCLRSRERRGEEMTSQTTNDLSCLRCFALQHFMYLNRLLEHRYLFVRRLVGDLLGNLRPRPASSTSSSPQSGGSSSNNNNSTSPLSIFPWVADWVTPPPPPSPSSPPGTEASHLRMPLDSNSSGTGEERASSQEASTSASSRSEPAKPISANARASAAVAAMYDASSPARAGSSAAARGGGTRREGPSVNYSGGWLSGARTGACGLRYSSP